MNCFSHSESTDLAKDDSGLNKFIIEKNKDKCYNQHMSEMEMKKCQDLKDVEEYATNQSLPILNRKELRIRKVWFSQLMNMK